jgi:hypothetical protein
MLTSNVGVCVPPLDAPPLLLVLPPPEDVDPPPLVDDEPPLYDEPPLDEPALDDPPPLLPVCACSPPGLPPACQRLPVLSLASPHATSTRIPAAAIPMAAERMPGHCASQAPGQGASKKRLTTGASAPIPRITPRFRRHAGDSPSDLTGSTSA